MTNYRMIDADLRAAVLEAVNVYQAVRRLRDDLPLEHPAKKDCIIAQAVQAGIIRAAAHIITLGFQWSQYMHDRPDTPPVTESTMNVWGSVLCPYIALLTSKYTELQSQGYEQKYKVMYSQVYAKIRFLPRAGPGCPKLTIAELPHKLGSEGSSSATAKKQQVSGPKAVAPQVATPKMLGEPEAQHDAEAFQPLISFDDQ